MGRRKSRPIQSRAVPTETETPSSSRAEPKSENAICSEQHKKPFYVDADGSRCRASDEHLDVAELLLNDVKFADGISDHGLIGGGLGGSLRFRLCGVEEGSFRLGQWPVLSADCMFLEYVLLGDVLFSGTIDGPDESVSGLAHLVSQKLMTVRLVSEVGSSGNTAAFRVRVEILQSAFDACGSLLEIARQPWRRSMMNVMSWLRPEVTTSEARYGSNPTGMEGLDSDHGGTGGFSSRKHAGFDADSFYEAIKPSKEEPIMDDEFPDLLPQLRPYQRRAVYWMVQREKCVAIASRGNMQNQQSAPICVPVVFLERGSRMFYNPFSGSVSLLPDSSSSYVSGGILADEMGLGKTVELLACIFAHRKPPLEDCMDPHDDTEDVGSQIRRQKRERVECICGAACESSKYEGLWVQCDICDAWQHADCVGYSPKKVLVSHEVYKRRGSKKVLSIQSTSHTRKSGSRNIIEMDGNYTCSLCSELTEAAKSKISAAATLIICPAPILVQWHSEIIRHTRSGSLKVLIYEGARKLSSATTSKTYMSELATADIVLTTYDVLKEDLSHDSDRHDGDRRFMRFQKRYPVVPTLLTRIHWWRLCLDEAQMVECNTASVTEMAMRLHAQHLWCVTGTPIQHRFDDMYGLLRFLRASPYDGYKWWVEVIRNPYERRDMAAMEFVHTFFKQIMWRSSKVHVSEELQLPPQGDSLSWLTFSPIEEHFYQKQHETCVRYAHAIIQSLKDDIHKRNSIPGYEVSCDAVLSHSEVAKLLYPLLKLRQACCHPQVGSSALCSLHHSPLTMEEILEVLISKAKIEGEEALRRIIVAINGLAGIAIIEDDNKRAVALYKEALTLTEENCADFRLDPLLSLHIHHNLAELFLVTSENMQQWPLMGAHPFESNEENREPTDAGKTNKYYVKRRKIGENNTPVLITNGSSLEPHKKPHFFNPNLSTVGDNGTVYHSECQVSSTCYTDGCLKKTCENIKQKYLSVFISRLSLVRQEFKNSYTQVCSISEEFKNQTMTWWLTALNLIDQTKESSEELIKKVDEAVSTTGNSSKSSKVSLRFGGISELKYSIQTSLDSLETSRQELLDRLREIDQTMEDPEDDDIERVRYCPICGDGGGDGPLCIHCELNGLFQVYEARLFLLTKGNESVVIASVEEALDLQKQKSELNQFFRDKKSSIESYAGESKQRHVRVDVQVSRKPSILEITLGVIKSHLKSKLGRQGVASARKHLLLFEAMRKEFAQARCLSLAQAKLLGAHSEIKWSISRLCLRVTEDEPTAVNMLSKEEIIPSSMQFSSDKFLSLSMLARVKGQLRYLKGLVSKKKSQHERQNMSSSPQCTVTLATSSLAIEESECLSKTDDELCPICHEKLCYQKMVFQCGHVVCCKCCLQLTEQAFVRFGKYQRNWIMCPTCRQHTDIENIAYVNEKQDKGGDLMASNTFQAQDASESSIPVRGSYGTKIEAVTRRILWIMSTDQEAKALIFSSWNDVLDVLEHALDANDITYARMKGGRKSQDAIAKFKDQNSPAGGGKTEKHVSKSKSVRVLLILIQHGANGLNLLEAQHVILVEPLLNPASEAQAISRVHRIGQEKPTLVHRFIVKNTVEESIYKLNRSRTASSIRGANPKHQDQPVLTIQDVETLFASTTPCELPEEEGVSGGSLSHLPPSVAAGLAAERRLMESHGRSS